MNKMMRIAMLLTVMVITGPLVFAAGPGFKHKVVDNLAACPLDGGLSFLLIAGAGYGYKKITGGKKKEEQPGK